MSLLESIFVCRPSESDSAFPNVGFMNIRIRQYCRICLDLISILGMSRQIPISVVPRKQYIHGRILCQLPFKTSA